MSFNVIFHSFKIFLYFNKCCSRTSEGVPPATPQNIAFYFAGVGQKS